MWAFINMNVMNLNELVTKGENVYRAETTGQYTQMPVLGMYTMHHSLVAFCAENINVIMCGSQPRKDLIAAGHKLDKNLESKYPETDNVDRLDAWANAHKAMRVLAFNILLLGIFVPNRADKFLQKCLRKAWGMTSFTPPLTWVTNNEKGSQLAGSKVQGMFEENRRTTFETIFTEINAMDHFNPCPHVTHAHDQDDLDFAHLVKGAMVNTDLQTVWAPKDESFLARVDDEAFLNVMWTFIK